ncbi:MAG: ABC transporter ATP-binding protein [Burkholderiaceae bacterium]
MSVLLRLDQVETFIGPYHILHGVSFSLAAGETLVILGRNGVGKTTTLRTIMGLWPCGRGQIEFKGQSIGGLPTEQIAQLGIGYVPENMGIFASLTVEENLLLAARSTRRAQLFDSDRMARIFNAMPALKKFWKTPAGSLSGGQKQMVAVARALIEPKALLIVDEPTKGLAPAIVESMAQAFRDIQAEGTALLFVEQNLSFAAQLSQRVVVMEGGRIAHEGPMQALTQNAALQDALLGLAL